MRSSFCCVEEKRWRCQTTRLHLTSSSNGGFHDVEALTRSNRSLWGCHRQGQPMSSLHGWIHGVPRKLLFERGSALRDISGRSLSRPAQTNDRFQPPVSLTIVSTSYNATISPA